VDARVRRQAMLVLVAVVVQVAQAQASVWEALLATHVDGRCSRGR
jgi:hypothetical protein